VGYVGRDVESIVRDLVEIAIDMVREEGWKRWKTRRNWAAEDRLIDLLLPPTPTAGPTAAAAVHEPGSMSFSFPAGNSTKDSHSDDKPGDREQKDKEKLRQQFREGKLD